MRQPFDNLLADDTRLVLHDNFPPAVWLTVTVSPPTLKFVWVSLVVMYNCTTLELAMPFDPRHPNFPQFQNPIPSFPPSRFASSAIRSWCCMVTLKSKTHP